MKWWDQMPELIQDWGNRLLEGTNKTLCTQFHWVRQGCGPCDQFDEFSMIVVFILSAFWWIWISGLWKLPHGKRLTEGECEKKSEGEVTQLCLTLCDPMDWSLPESSIHGIFQARILEWVAISFFRRSSHPRDWTLVSHIAGRRFTVWATREVNWGETGSYSDGQGHAQ